MKRLLSLLAWPVVLAMLLCVSACQRDLVPPLVDVTDVTPRELELGDRIELRGSGFPQGHSARITFKGSLHRPGEPPVKNAVIEATGAVESFDRIDLAFSDVMEEKFCGHGERAAHTTFRGDVEVAFASSAPGAAPLTGTLRNVAVDVRPSGVGSAIADARNAEGVRVLSFLGVTAGVASARGLTVESVAPGSPAERAAIQPGDVLVEADGVRLFSPADLAPSGARTMDVLVRHGLAEVEDTRTIALVGYSSDRIPAEYVPAVLLVGLALAWLLVLVMPSPPWLSGLELRSASLLRATTWRIMMRSLFGSGPRALVSVLASVLVGTFALGPHVVDADLDGGILLAFALALLAASRVAAAKGFFGSIKAVLGVALAGLALALSVLGVVFLEGAFQLVELVRVQGGAPWELAAARQPAALVLGLAYIAILFATLRRRETGTGITRTVSANVDLLERLGLFVACALGVAIFFGGWRLPGIAATPALGMHVLAATIFVLKTWALACLVRAALALASPWSPGGARSFAVKKIIPALVLGGGLVVLARRLSPGSAFEIACGATVATATLLFAARSVLRVRDAMTRPEAHASPFSEGFI